MVKARMGYPRYLQGYLDSKAYSFKNGTDTAIYLEAFELHFIQDICDDNGYEVRSQKTHPDGGVTYQLWRIQNGQNT